MRLTVNLEKDLYGVARALAKAEDLSISEAVNRLIRQALTGRARRTRSRSGFPVVRGRRPFGPDDVAAIDLES